MIQNVPVHSKNKKTIKEKKYTTWFQYRVAEGERGRGRGIRDKGRGTHGVIGGVTRKK